MPCIDAVSGEEFWILDPTERLGKPAALAHPALAAADITNQARSQPTVSKSLTVIGGVGDRRWRGGGPNCSPPIPRGVGGPPAQSPRRAWIWYPWSPVRSALGPLRDMDCTSGGFADLAHHTSNSAPLRPGSGRRRTVPSFLATPRSEVAALRASFVPGLRHGIGSMIDP
jgi:hypothetical protein